MGCKVASPKAKELPGDGEKFLFLSFLITHFFCATISSGLGQARRGARPGDKRAWGQWAQALEGFIEGTGSWSRLPDVLF